ncbi:MULTISPECIES: amino acid ABC transporter ATP-binding/permease protein [Marinomonas]|uniref:ATP-binding cassette domain-containing protein n=1 Tax=Marinomonas arctica TaxID=383750 RepID=A0A7H1J2U8_9GAMM|nr:MULTISPECIES: ATP-binding cassette domain-containing protein [Marinomonas]MCS7486526.1 ABC transporter [Marinomonas sp. BSi20414]QNT04814.1 ATP-binding cassette domain-containing protein [Marinomonas arctica]GGN31065.1 cysteine/glutathione ABC transporter ATP-binding protein/permease CydC [Marinomonas arctica]
MNNVPKLSLKRLLLANPWGFIIPVVTGMAATLAGVALLGLSGWFISAAGLATAMGVGMVFNYLTPGAIVRGLSILRTAGRYGEQVTAHNHLFGLLRILRLWVWDQRVAKDAANLHEQSRGDLLQRLVNDLDQIIRWPLVVFLPWIYALSAYLAVSIFAYFITPVLLWPIAIAALLQILVVPYVCGRFASHAVHVGLILGVHRRSRFVSLFSALITLTIRGHWKDYAQRLGELDERQRRMEIRIQQAISLGRLLSYGVTILLIASSFFLLSERNPETNHWTLIAGVQGTWVVGYVLSLLAVNELVLPLVQSFVAQGQSQVGLRRLNQLHQDAQAQPEGKIDRIQQMVFKHWRGFHASSGMGNTAIDLSANLGDTLWLRGASGSGKSTLLAAIAGDCLSSGEAIINNEKCDLYSNQNYQAQLSYLPQSPYIFQQSIAANLYLGNPNASDEQLWAVLDAVCLADWVKSLPNGLETLLSSQGRNLSGGQRKRLALARLLLREAPVLLLDEPFDGLDKATIERICHSLQNDYKPDILILVSHVGSRIGDNARVIEL